MANEDLNIGKTIEKKEGFNFKKELTALFTVLSLQYGIAQTNMASPDTITKTQTEVVQQGEDPVKELMTKFNITDIKTASLEQLEAALIEVRAILNTIPKEDTKKRAPLVDRRTDLKGQITIRQEEALANDKITQLKNENEKKKILDQQIKDQVETLNQNINNKKQTIDTLKKEIEVAKTRLAATTEVVNILKHGEK